MVRSSFNNFGMIGYTLKSIRSWGKGQVNLFKDVPVFQFDPAFVLIFGPFRLKVEDIYTFAPIRLESSCRFSYVPNVNLIRLPVIRSDKTHPADIRRRNIKKKRPLHWAGHIAPSVPGFLCKMPPYL